MHYTLLFCLANSAALATENNYAITPADTTTQSSQETINTNSCKDITNNTKMITDIINENNLSPTFFKTASSNNNIITLNIPNVSLTLPIDVNISTLISNWKGSIMFNSNIELYNKIAIEKQKR